MEERYCNLEGFIQGKMKEPEISEPSHPNITTGPSIKVRLPQLLIPNFTGNLQEWVTFKDTFMSLVGDNINIPNVQKFHYLLSTNKGDAQRVIQHIPLREQGFNVAWELLVERYEN
jgi:hypothetical protein